MGDADEHDEPHKRNAGTPQKDIWYKLGTIGGISTAVMVAIIGSIGSCMLKDQQTQSNRVQLYTELMSKREDSENALRKDMFQQILSSFLTEDPGGECTVARLDKMLLYLELISRNFHETLDIRPLFYHVLLKIVTEIPKLQEPSARAEKYNRYIHMGRTHREPDAAKKARICEDRLRVSWQRKQRPLGQENWKGELTWKEWTDSLKERKLNQLIDIARRISTKQMESLSGMLERMRMTIDLSETCRDKTPLEEPTGCIEEPQTKTCQLTLHECCRRTFKISVSRSYPGWNRVLIKVETRKTPKEIARDREGPKSHVSEFWVGHFRFPLVDNTFLSEKERYAVILDELDEEKLTAKISLLYFPATLAGLKEKSFYQQRMISTLLSEENLFVTQND